MSLPCILNAYMANKVLTDLVYVCLMSSFTSVTSFCYKILEFGVCLSDSGRLFMNLVYACVHREADKI